MYILGINAYHGDSSACLYHNDKLIMAIEEERFRRIKHWAGFPDMAIKACLKEAGITISEVDHISISRNPKANLSKKILHVLTRFKSLGSLMDRIANQRKVVSMKGILAQRLGVEEKFVTAQFHNVEHHRAHIASSFLASPYEEAALLSVDGFGDFSSTMTGIGRGTHMTIQKSVLFPHSIGVFYTAFTQYLGFMNYGDEYKVMGLAPYGQPVYLEKMKDVIKLTDDGFFKLNQKYFKHATEGVAMSWEDCYPTIEAIFSKYMVEKFGPARQKTDEITQQHKDMAASIQRMSELVIFHILNHLHKQTKLDTVCIAGGVAQNSVANGKIYENTPFKNVYIPPAATDAGTCLGAALYTNNVILGNPRLSPIKSGNLGCKYSNEEIEKLLNEKKLSYKKLSDSEITEEVTECLMNGGVVGWMRDRSEFGPRALGFRSILCDARRADAKDILNSKIKRRESFRPFAPSILNEYIPEYFETTAEVPFMEKVFRIRPEKHSIIPAVTHVDGTGRLQSVHQDTNPHYYNLIKRFHDKTGVPILLNTSFNENEPIVNAPAEALDCYLRTNMDMLVMENCVLKR